MSVRRAPWLGPRRLLSALLLFAGVLGTAVPAAAWNATGHVSIALLAYDALPRTQRAALVQLLKAHPRLEQDIIPALPPSLPEGARDRWLFALAATWPDLARGQPSYDQGTWHYVNLPLSLRGGQLVQCQTARRDFPESVRRIAALDAARRARGLPGTPSGDSIREALPKNLRTLADASAPREARALSLSWVLHLVGDAHQPLHAVALFTHDRFVTGDRGGNDILVRDRGPLHRVWDELLGSELTSDAVEAGLRQVVQGGRLPPAKPAPLGVAAVDTWLNEGCELARRAVYVPAILRAVERFEENPGTDAAAPVAVAEVPAADPAVGAPLRQATAPAPGKPELALSAEYVQRARHQAFERARQAAARLARLLAGIRP